MARYAVVKGGTVENVIVLDRLKGWAVPPGSTLVVLDEDNDAAKGWVLEKDGRFYAPEPPAAPSVPDLPPSPNAVLVSALESAATVEDLRAALLARFAPVAQAESAARPALLRAVLARKAARKEKQAK